MMLNLKMCELQLFDASREEVVCVVVRFCQIINSWERINVYISFTQTASDEIQIVIVHFTVKYAFVISKKDKKTPKSIICEYKTIQINPSVQSIRQVLGISTPYC